MNINVVANAVESVKAPQQKSETQGTSKDFAVEIKKVSSKENKKGNDNVKKSTEAPKKENSKIKENSTKELSEEEINEVEEVSNESLASILDLLKTLISSEDDKVSLMEFQEQGLKGDSIINLLNSLNGEKVNLSENIENTNNDLLAMLKETKNAEDLLQKLGLTNEALEGNKEILSNIEELLSKNNGSNIEDHLANKLPIGNNPINSSEGKNETNLLDTSFQYTKVTEQQPASEERGNLSGGEKNLSKEDSILNNLVNGEEGEDKVTRVNDFISILNRNIDSTNKVSFDEPVVMTKSNLNNDVIKALTYMDQNGIKDLTVKIYPKELGQVTISIVMEQGALKANIKATSKEAVDLLSSGLREINEKIGTQNIKIESVNIGLYENDTTYFSGEKKHFDGQQRENENSNLNSNGEVDLEEGQDTTDKSSNGALDILI